MSLDQIVRNALAGWPVPSIDGARVTVPTHCLYPSNGIVSVIIEGGAREFQVHDDAGAIEELEAAGGRLRETVSLLRPIAARQGLTVSDSGLIRSPRVGEAELAATIALVANASKEAAHELIDRLRPPSRRNFRDALARLLETEFGTDRMERVPIVGRSNKPHKFDYVIRLAPERHLLLDAVTPEASSISAAVVAHLDVQQASRHDVVQRIIYDDQERWTAADLSLLAMGAPVLAFSATRDALKRLAA